MRRYTRNDPRGIFPKVTGLPGIEHNRMAIFWRPIIDMTDSEVAPMRLRMVQPVSAWLAEPEEERWSWFAMIGVAGLRSQALRHAGLTQYDCREPTGLAEEFRTPQWNRLLDAIARFDQLPYSARSLVVFQLAQLSYCEYVFKIAGVVQPNGDPAHDRYAYEVGRVHARFPGHAAKALPVFEKLATIGKDPLIALASCAQGIGHTIRSNTEIELAQRFDGYGQQILLGLPDTWHAWLVRSRFHRAVALLRLAEKQFEQMRHELDLALEFSEKLFPGTEEGTTDKTVALENKRILTESQIKSVSRARGKESAEQVRKLCERLDRLDPYCIEARLVVADGYAAIGDYEEAALRYTRAGDLGTVSGAVGWFRAGQVYDFLGDRASALNAMGRCLELDASAIEAAQYLESVRY
ncbi:hypothetical protein Rhe02_62770 [Rhizocola hellebori]|uniref:Tetratricopeptide repeat protein n=1 Tax=Rhizocola hellebori TaxID=1392758 RepID=A0A8J3QEN6_9ACTN|nr:hypothetical protein [Rhizocola hellebori]GIH08210.1 hypothetical protein Rhe02_62770 [Rhizocola hellebori]